MTKADILAEIRRTAEVNGGEPLGFRRFLTETGIRKSDWEGVYWARWGDAIREAGFTANQFTEAIAIPELLEQFAKLALEIGGIPTSAEIRLEIRRFPGFPNSKTFERIGSKEEVVSQLREYCRGRDGYEDVIRFCDEYAPRQRQDEVEGPLEEAEGGFVYLIKSGKFYKVGMTNSIGRREYELGIQLPERATTTHVIRTDDPAGIEEYWHRRFAQKRMNGEWFALNAQDVTAFKRRRFM